MIIISCPTSMYYSVISLPSQNPYNTWIKHASQWDCYSPWRHRLMLSKPSKLTEDYWKRLPMSTSVSPVYSGYASCAESRLRILDTPHVQSPGCVSWIRLMCRVQGVYPGYASCAESRLCILDMPHVQSPGCVSWICLLCRVKAVYPGNASCAESRPCILDMSHVQSPGHVSWVRLMFRVQAIYLGYVSCAESRPCILDTFRGPSEGHVSWIRLMCRVQAMYPRYISCAESRLCILDTSHVQSPGCVSWIPIICADSRLSTLHAWVLTHKVESIDTLFSWIILMFHQYFGIKDILLSLNPSGLHFVHPGLECREPWLSPGCVPLDKPHRNMCTAKDVRPFAFHYRVFALPKLSIKA